MGGGQGGCVVQGSTYAVEPFLSTPVPVPAGMADGLPGEV